MLSSNMTAIITRGGMCTATVELTKAGCFAYKVQELYKNQRLCANNASSQWGHGNHRHEAVLLLLLPLPEEHRCLNDISELNISELGFTGELKRF